LTGVIKGEGAKVKVTVGLAVIDGSDEDGGGHDPAGKLDKAADLLVIHSIGSRATDRAIDIQRGNGIAGAKQGEHAGSSRPGGDWGGRSNGHDGRQIGRVRSAGRLSKGTDGREQTINNGGKNTLQAPCRATKQFHKIGSLL
jgi:hypothetical protein